MLEGKGMVKTQDLAKEFNVTPQTICRDINELFNEGKAKRVHGGAILPATMNNLNYTQRAISNYQGKEKIANIAAKYVSVGQTIFMGYGSTVANLAANISMSSAIKVITNNLDVATALENSDSEVWLSGGRVRNKQRDLTGYATASFLNSFRADIAFCGVGAIDSKGDLLEFNYEEAELSRVMLANAKQKIVLADHSKFRRHASVFCTRLAEIDVLITDFATDEVVELCDTHKVELVYR